MTRANDGRPLALLADLGYHVLGARPTPEGTEVDIRGLHDEAALEEDLLQEATRRNYPPYYIAFGYPMANTMTVNFACTNARERTK